MEMRVEQLSATTDIPVDTIRYYQSKGLLDPPRREGRVAWYNDDHLRRLERIRVLQHNGFTLATIARLVSGDLDAADEALLSELAGVNDQPKRSSGEAGPTGSRGDLFTIEELAVETGVPLALLKALEAEALLIPRRIGDHRYYTEDDVAAANAGLLVLEWGVPLSALLEVARRHHESTTAVARDAVELFSAYVRRPLREGHPPHEDLHADDVDRLTRAYAELLPAVNTLVANHFTRTLVACALDHVEQVGSHAERLAVSERADADQADRPTAAHVPMPARLR
jgi:DNA-binding transcriptional MerR regulator